MPARRSIYTSQLGACPCSGVNLDRLIQPAILIILAEGRLHGYRIVERIAEIEQHKPDATGVYRALRSMEKRGLIDSAWSPSVVGPAKKSYWLTDEGTLCLARWVETLERHSQTVQRLLYRAERVLFQPRGGPLG